MNRILLLLAFVTALAACGKPSESLKTRLWHSDRIEIVYYGSANAATNPVLLLNLSDVDGLCTMVTDKEADPKQCAYEGKITFKKADSTVFIGDFNLSPDCAHIAYEDGGEKYYRKLTNSSIVVLGQLKIANQASKLDDLAWFIGQWKQIEGPDLVSVEEWKRNSPTLYTGKAWTTYQLDTVHVESIELRLEEGEVYYIPTVIENKGPVRFKMTHLDGKSVLFENPTHDFPQKISYEALGDTMLMAKISGVMNGKEAIKEFPLHRVIN